MAGPSGPDLEGSIVTPDPTSTGTGYLLVAGWIQSMGEAGAWRFMDELDRNISAYLPSGAAPCAETAAGHSAIGLTYDVQAARLKAQGAPVDVAVPIDGVGWDLEAFAIVKGSRHEDLARKIVDWAAGLEANRLYAQTYAIVARPGVFAAPAAYPPFAEARMIRNDLAWMADDRVRILADWKRRYGAKVSPKRP